MSGGGPTGAAERLTQKETGLAEACGRRVSEHRNASANGGIRVDRPIGSGGGGGPRVFGKGLRLQAERALRVKLLLPAEYDLWTGLPEVGPPKGFWSLWRVR